MCAHEAVKTYKQLKNPKAHIKKVISVGHAHAES